MDHVAVGAVLLESASINGYLMSAGAVGGTHGGEVGGRVAVLGGAELDETLEGSRVARLFIEIVGHLSKPSEIPYHI